MKDYSAVTHIHCHDRFRDAAGEVFRVVAQARDVYSPSEYIIVYVSEKDGEVWNIPASYMSLFTSLKRIKCTGCRCSYWEDSACMCCGFDNEEDL